MKINKTKKITFRCSEEFASFLDEISKKLKIERSELLRNALLHFFLSFELGSVNTPLRTLIHDYMEKIHEEESEKKLIKKEDN